MATVDTYGRDLAFHVHVHVLCPAGLRGPPSRRRLAAGQALSGRTVPSPLALLSADAPVRAKSNTVRLTSIRLSVGATLCGRPRSKATTQGRPYIVNRTALGLKGNQSAKCRIGRLFKKYPAGFIVNVMSQYKSGRKAAAYCCRYTGRPPLSERRIVSYDGKQVTLAYKDYRDGNDKTLTLSVEEFLFRVLQHVWPRYQRDVHYYGLYQPARRKHHVAEVAKASRYGDQVRPVPPLSRRERLQLATAGKQLVCPECNGRFLLQFVQLPSKRRAKKGAGPPAKTDYQCALSL
jgi:hypothetical protein